MPLTTGSRLGPYEIIGPLGAGGMGEVYRARDSRLGRDVAIKVLPAHLCDDPDLKKRFEREARAISSLQHPHICTLHDIGAYDGIDCLVMEYLEGETLEERVKRGPLKLPDALRIAREIAGALETAHRHGIVHRDLKPANIMLTRTGAKLMDFGVARPAPGVVATAAGPSTPNTPTVSIAALTSPGPALTEKGTILGTFQYMAPEVLQGGEATARSDIFSFGCVLYEMMTGRHAFEGKSRLGVITAILERDPEPLASAHSDIPPALDFCVRTCLAKDPEERYSSAHDLSLQLRLLETMPQIGARLDPQVRRARAAWWTAAGSLVLTGAILAAVSLRQEAEEADVMFASIPAPDGLTLVSTSIFAGPVEISPDGSKLVFSAQEAQSAQMLWVRHLNAPQARVLAGTEGATRPFWSPDSRHIGFFAEGKLKRVSVEGGPVFTLAEVADDRGGSWSGDGTILYSPDSLAPLFSISAAGGRPVQETRLGELGSDRTHRYPHFLPGQKRYLVLVRTAGAGSGEGAGIFAGEIGRPGLKRVLDAASNVVVTDGYILFVRERSLLAQRFDEQTLETVGEPVPLADDLRMDERFSRGVFSVSRTGLLVYQTGTSTTTLVLQEIAREGSVLSTIGQPAEYFNGGNPQYWPGGTKASAAIVDIRTGHADLWQLDLRSGTRNRITTGPGDKQVLAVSPDATQIAYPRLDRAVTWEVLVQPVSGAAPARSIAGGSQEALAWFVDDWSPDGKYVLITTRAAPPEAGIRAVPVNGGEPLQVVRTGGRPTTGQVSPDGRFIAYASDETGRDEVYVAPFPQGPGRWQVSQAGGAEPRWRGDGRELFFFAPDNRLMAAQVTITPDDFQVGGIKGLFRSTKKGIAGWRYDVSPDGQRFLVTSALPESSKSHLTIVSNWTKLLRN